MDDEERITRLRAAMHAVSRGLHTVASGLGAATTVQTAIHIERALVRSAATENLKRMLETTDASIRALRGIEGELADLLPVVSGSSREAVRRQSRTITTLRKVLATAADAFLTDTQPIDVKKPPPDHSGGGE